MKKSILFISIVAPVLMVIIGSCRKYETQPKDWFTVDLTFDSLDKNGTVTAFDLNNIYTYLPNGYNWVDLDFLDAGTS